MSSSSAATTSVGPSGLDTLPDVQRHSPRVCSVLGQNPSAMTLQGTNCYVIGSGSHRILIDTGEGMPAYAAILRDWLQTEKVTQLTILLTHWHADHTGGVKSVCELFDSAHQPHIYKFGGADLIPSSVLRAFPELATRVQPMLDGQEFAVEGATLRAIHTPGHTTDHCIFELLEERAVISGDNVLGASTAVFSDLHSYMHSLRRIAQCQPQRIYPAHGPIIDGAEAPKRVEQYMQHRLQREGQILQAMKDIASESHAEADHKDPTAVELVQRICTYPEAVTRNHWASHSCLWLLTSLSVSVALIRCRPLADSPLRRCKQRAASPRQAASRAEGARHRAAERGRLRSHRRHRRCHRQPQHRQRGRLSRRSRETARHRPTEIVMEVADCQLRCRRTRP